MAAASFSSLQVAAPRHGLLHIATRRCLFNSAHLAAVHEPGASVASRFVNSRGNLPKIGSLAAATLAFGSVAARRRHSSSLSAAATIDERRVAANGDAVRVHYEGKLEDGSVFDSSDGKKPLSFIVGAGQVVPGFDDAVRGLTAGETVEVSIPPEKAYGSRNEELVLTIPKDQAPDGLTQGMTAQLQMAGRVIPARVVGIAEDGTVTIDLNPFLAGKTLNFKITLEGFRELLAPSEPPPGMELATFAAGCFWGVELAFQRIAGVISTSVGYAQGEKEAPTYEEVCQATTGHTEAVRVVFDPSVVSYDELLATLWERVGKNAITLNRAGNDEGPQYRSGIYFHNPAQEAAALASRLSLQSAIGQTVVTEVEAAAPFWLAEDYHQQYLANGGRNGQAQSAAKGCKDEIRCYG